MKANELVSSLPPQWLARLAALLLPALAPLATAEEAPVAIPVEIPDAEQGDREPDVVYVPTPQSVVEKMLEMAEVKKGDVVYDLGCGDGRIVVTAAKKYGVKAVGYDIDPERVKEARENVRKNGVGHLVTIEQKDIFKLDLSEASVVALYLLPYLNERLMPQLAKLKPGSRIVSHAFDMGDAKPVEVHEMEVVKPDNSVSSFGSSHTVYKWVVPWKTEEKPAFVPYSESQNSTEEPAAEPAAKP